MTIYNDSYTRAVEKKKEIAENLNKGSFKIRIYVRVSKVFKI